jgi:Cu(I)/Ag(I) efflux system membrane fusion protein
VPTFHSIAKKLRIAGLLVLGLVALLTVVACSKSGASGVRYHCPMHPTYITDKPGDCPICGMRLVPIEQGKAAAPGNVAGQTTAPAAIGTEGTVWTCPMHPEVRSDKPGRCPKCGMPLEPQAPASDDAGAATVPEGMAAIDVDPEGLQLAGVRTSVARRATIERTIRAAGIVRADETRVRHVHTKVSGWVEKLFVNFTGESVRKGQPVLTLYSQELLATQQEYLRAREAAKGLEQSTYAAARQGADEVQAAARRRLELFDVPSTLIAQLDRTGTPQRTVTLLAPASGIITGKQTFEGQQVDPGMDLFTVSDLSRVWIEADVFENEANAVHVGDQAKISLPYDMGAPMTGRVKYIYPYLDPNTRTLKIRFEFANPGLKLKLDAYLNVEIPVQSDEGVVIPDSAIMDTGLRRIVFVNTRPGHFEPRLVKIGIRSEGQAQILAGVKEGEAVAIKANFLLDSESRLRAAIAAPAAPPATPASATAHP